jgi:hypothetical protein
MTTLSRPALLATALGCAALLAGAATPASADPPVGTVTLEDAWTIRADGTNELAAFVNITREAFCTPEEVAAEQAFLEWLRAGAVGEPPGDYPYAPAAVLLDMTVQDVGRGNLRAMGSATVPVELWTFEAGKSWAAGNLVSPCLDTDGVDDTTGAGITSGALLAAGSGLYALKDNDWAGTGPRTNVWSEALTAAVTGGSVDYTYTFDQKNMQREGEYLKGADRFTLKAR